MTLNMKHREYHLIYLFFAESNRLLNLIVSEIYTTNNYYKFKCDTSDYNLELKDARPGLMLIFEILL